MLSKGTKAICRAARRVFCCVPAARTREEELEKEKSHGQMLSEGTPAICPVILEKTGLAAESFALAAKYAALNSQNVALAPENVDLAAEITALTAEKAAVTAKKAVLTAAKAAQAPENMALAAEISALTAQKVALTAYNAGQVRVPELSVLIAETTVLMDEKVALVGCNSGLNARKDQLKRQQNALCAALAEDNGAARAALEKQKITLAKKINPSALKLLQATFNLANTEKNMETARAKEEDLETELEVLKKTRKVEQEARFKQREDLINKIIEKEEKLFIEQQAGQLNKQNTELQEISLKTNEKKAKVKKQKQENKEQLEREKKERERLKKTEKKEKEEREELKKTEKKEKKEWIERQKREKKEREKEKKEREQLMKREKKERSHAICLELRRTLGAVLLVKPGLAPEIAESAALQAENAAIVANNVALAAENKVLTVEKAALAAEITSLTAENVAAEAEIAALAAENVAQAAEIADLDAQIAALAVEIVAQAPDITFLVAEIASLGAEIAGLTAEKAALSDAIIFLERQLDVLLAARAEGITAKNVGLEEQHNKLTNEMEYIALKLCRATFTLSKRENALKTARAREEELEQEIEDLKITMRVEQEASSKQNTDMIINIKETEKKMSISRRGAHPEQWPMWAGSKETDQPAPESIKTETVLVCTLQKSWAWRRFIKRM